MRVVQWLPRIDMRVILQFYDVIPMAIPSCLQHQVSVQETEDNGAYPARALTISVYL